MNRILTLLTVFIVILFFTFLLIFMNKPNNVNNTDSIVDKQSGARVTKLIGGEVEKGFTKVELNDSTTILIYRGTESCTMIQLK